MLLKSLQIQQIQLDGLGKFASGLCAVHCALCAFLPGLFALIGLEILVGHEAE